MKKASVLFAVIYIGLATLVCGQSASYLYAEPIDPDVAKLYTQRASKENLQELLSLPPEQAVPLAVALASPRVTSSTVERDRYVTLALELAQSAELPEMEAEIRYYKSLQLSNENRLSDALVEVKKSEELFEESNATNVWIMASVMLKGNIEHRHGRLDDAIATCDDLAVMAEAATNTYYLAHALQDGGLIRYKQGRHKGVKENLERALELFRELNDQDGIAETLKSLGNCYNLIDDDDKAMLLYQEAAAIYKDSQNSHGQANCLFNTGLLYQEQGKYQDALNLFEEAKICFIQAGSIGGVGICHMETGKTYLLMKDYAQSEMALNMARKELSTRQSYRRLAQTEGIMGDLYKAQGDTEKAKEHLKESVRLYKKLGLKSAANYRAKHLKVLTEKQKKVVGDQAVSDPVATD